MALKFKSEQDLKKMLNVRCTSRCAIRQDDTTDEVYRQAVQAIRDIQSSMYDLLLGDDIEIKIVVKGKTRADIDNVFKGISDSLQGLIYKNDKQIKKGSFEHKYNENKGARKISVNDQLINAAETGDLKGMHKAINKGADDFHEALYRAVVKGQIDAVKLLVKFIEEKEKCM